MLRCRCFVPLEKKTLFATIGHGQSSEKALKIEFVGPNLETTF